MTRYYITKKKIYLVITDQKKIESSTNDITIRKENKEKKKENERGLDR